jgi:hypothetical protein
VRQYLETGNSDHETEGIPVTLIVEQTGTDCLVTIYDQTKTVPNCNALKLASTLFDKPGVEKYTPKEMWNFGFQIR